MILNFSMSELIYSDTAVKKNICNMPDINSMDNLLLLIVNILQPLRNALKKPVSVSSGYRCPAVNKLVGGKPNSQHLKGQAADITVKGMTINELFNFIIKSGIEFDQLIHEGTWVHISYNKGKNRKQILRK